VRVTPPTQVASRAPRNVVVPRPRPEAPKPDPVIAVIAAEDSTSVGIDGATFVLTTQLGQTFPVPNPRPVASANSLPTPAPRPVTLASAKTAATESDGNKRWAVQIGAFNDKLAAQAHLAKYAERSMDVVGQAERLVVPMASADGQTVYRARFGLFAENEARAVCRRMTSRGETCFAVLQAT